jgi:hypothetical protein
MRKPITRAELFAQLNSTTPTKPPDPSPDDFTGREPFTPDPRPRSERRSETNGDIYEDDEALATTRGRRGSLPGFNVDDQKVQDEVDNLVYGQRTRIWIEGHFIVDEGDHENTIVRPKIDHIEDLIRKLPSNQGRGALIVRRKTIPLDRDDTFEGESRRDYRRWTHNRVTADDVANTVVLNPGITREMLIEKLYRTEPWHDAARAVAAGKLAFALHRLKRKGTPIFVRYQGKVARFFPHGTPTRLPTTPGTSVAPPAFNPEPYLIENVRPVSRVLLQLFGKTQPTRMSQFWWDDRAKDVLNALIKASMATNPTVPRTTFIKFVEPDLEVRAENVDVPTTTAYWERDPASDKGE